MCLALGVTPAERGAQSGRDIRLARRWAYLTVSIRNVRDPSAVATVLNSFPVGVPFPVARAEGVEKARPAVMDSAPKFNVSSITSGTAMDCLKARFFSTYNGRRVRWNCGGVKNSLITWILELVGKFQVLRSNLPVNRTSWENEPRSRE